MAPAYLHQVIANTRVIKAFVCYYYVAMPNFTLNLNLPLFFKLHLEAKTKTNSLFAYLADKTDSHCDSVPLTDAAII